MNFFFLIFFFYNFLLFLCNSYICYLSLKLSSLLSISILFLFFTFFFILLFGIIFNLKLNPFRVIILFSWSAFKFRKKEMEIGWVSVRERGKEKQIEITRKRGREIISEVVGRESWRVIERRKETYVFYFFRHWNCLFREPSIRASVFLAFTMMTVRRLEECDETSQIDFSVL